MTVMPWTVQRPGGMSLAREVVFPAAAAAVIVMSADVRMPLGLPGHRGLVWLTLLVAVALTARKPPTVLAVGAVSTTATVLLQSGPGPWASARYLGAAALLCLLTTSPAIRSRRWLVALAAAPIHLVALVVPITTALMGGHGLAFADIGDKVAFHLGFGLVAGVLGWATAALIDRATNHDS
ncbi:hypothetical protein [Mycolicibacter longobardus]|uniref:Uncharacterized protein n=1 Tax=Mycolicibacter longobardus TaxID=1108812 RepID=A0A1X1YBD3_9MYCO|nr:hypothetical protein [Mycolicibacter longobardus]MCV7386246.1 hypothetical protein [Mycolicibacter longobardus]ORW08334.1 hypothetical protein AWC16_19790 [Mycolicibacter longobardus]